MEQITVKTINLTGKTGYRRPIRNISHEKLKDESEKRLKAYQEELKKYEEEMKRYEEEEKDRNKERKTYWQWLEVFSFSEKDPTEPVISGKERWINMSGSVQDSLDKLLEEDKEKEFEFKTGKSVFKIDLKNMMEITVKTSNPDLHPNGRKRPIRHVTHEKVQQELKTYIEAQEQIYREYVKSQMDHPRHYFENEKHLIEDTKRHLQNFKKDMTKMIEEKRDVYWQWLSCYGHSKDDWCEPVFYGDEVWNNFSIELTDKFDKLVEEKESEYEFSVGDSKFKIDFKKK